MDAGALLGLEIQLLADAGRKEEARDRLASDEAGQLPEHVRSYIGTMVEEQGNPAISKLEELYAQNPSLTLLGDLVTRYEEIGFSARYLELARKLVFATRRSENLRSVVGFLLDHGERGAAASLLSELPDLTSANLDLLSCAAGLAFYQGRLEDAEQALKTLEQERDTVEDRTLRYHLLLATGRWPELDVFLEQEWTQRENRSPRELAELADLASKLRSTRFRDFLDLAVELGSTDPNVLVGAYNAVTRAGIEESVPDAGHWIMRAAELSDENGPVQRASLEGLLEGREDWENRVDEAWRLLATAKLPLTATAIMLRRPWLELHLVSLLTNPHEPAKHRAIVPLFGGKRGPREEVAADIGAIALDRTAIMTLAALGLLEQVLNTCQDVHIAHNTLADLFEQRERLTFHQPSKISFAHQLVALVARGKALAFSPTATADPALAADIGISLAELLGEASAHPDGQHLVVHPYPITRVGSMLREPMDLSAFDAQLVSCAAVVDFIERKGRLTTREIQSVRAYLTQHDRPWPNEPAIGEGATLYLSDLSVEYFRFTGVLEKIAAAGLKVIISRSELSQSRALIEHEHVSDEVGAIIEATRRALSASIGAGHIKLDGRDPDEEDKEAFLSLGRLAESAPILVCDDRFINQYDRFDRKGGQTRILTSLELVETLVGTGRLDAENVGDIRTRLRQMGALFVPSSATEISAFIAQAQVRDDALIETGELRALRENVRLIQYRGWFEPQVDAYWLLSFQNAIVDTMIGQWSDDIEDAVSRARCDWLFCLVDFRDWTHTVAEPRPLHLALDGIIMAIGKLVTSAVDLKGDARRRFSAWLEADILAPLWYREPALEQKFQGYMRDLIRSLGHQDLMQGRVEDLSVVSRMRLLLGTFPEFLQVALSVDDEFSNELNLTVSGLVTLGAEHRTESVQFDREAFFRAITSIYTDPSSDVFLADKEGAEWTMSVKEEAGDWPLTLSRDSERMELRGIPAFHPVSASRLGGFELVATDVKLPADSRAIWLSKLNNGPLGHIDIEELNEDLADTPTAVARALAVSVSAMEVALDQLVPLRERYYRRLIQGGNGDNLEAFVGQMRSKLPALIKERNLDGAREALLLASHPRIVSSIGIKELEPDEIESLGQWVTAYGDLFAKIGFVEAVLDLAVAGSNIEALVIKIVSEVAALPIDEESSELRYLSALIMFVDGEISRKQILRDWPPFMRRVAAIAQAALVARTTVGKVETEHFAKSAIADRGWRFVIQSLVDLRQEPRWRPDYVEPAQIQHEFVGRILNRAGELSEDGLSDNLKDLIFGEAPGKLQPRRHFPMNYWPGPIEGAISDELPLPPPSYQTGIEGTLSQQTVTISQLAGVINSSGMFRLPDEQIERMVDLIRQSGPSLFPDFASDEVQIGLVGLGYVAAAHRNVALAEQVRVLARSRRFSSATPIAVDDDMHLALVAAAANADLSAWRQAVGDWILEVASSVSTSDAAQDCASWIEALCEIDPALHCNLGRSRAALALSLEK